MSVRELGDFSDRLYHLVGFLSSSFSLRVNFLLARFRPSVVDLFIFRPADITGDLGTICIPAPMTFDNFVFEAEVS